MMNMIIITIAPLIVIVIVLLTYIMHAWIHS